jgi:hypothetical protein
MKRFIITTFLLSLWLTNDVAAQTVQSDSVIQDLSARTYAFGARTAERLMRAVIKHRAHLGIWPIEADDVRAFLQTNPNTRAGDSWEPCRLTGEADGCMISVLITPGQSDSYYLADTLRIRRLDIRLYATAEPEPTGPPPAGRPFLRANITGELRSGELLTIDGRLIELQPYNAPPRYLDAASAIADSILFVR